MAEFSNGREQRETGDPEASGFGSSRRRVLVELLILALLVVLVPLGVVLAAGRFAALLLPWVPLSVDRTLGEHAALALNQTQEPCDAASVRTYVAQLTEPLVDAAGATFPFEFQVVNDPVVNAFALPGGYVFINSGLLERAESSQEVAAVLSHELQHVLQRHSTARLLTSLGGSVVLAALFGATDLGVPAGLASDLVQNGYSRDQEAEADQRGIELLVAAGIDPSGMATFFERLTSLAQAPPEFLSTHPDPGNRAAAARLAARGHTASRTLPPLPRVQCHDG